MKWKMIGTAATVTASVGLLLAGCGSTKASSSGENAGNLSGNMAKTQVLNWSENGGDLSLIHI